MKNKLFICLFITLMLILFLLSSFVLALKGNTTASNYDTFSKFDFGIAGNSTSTNTTSRFISGNEPVSNYTSSSFTGRLGILSVKKNLAINLTSPLSISKIIRGSDTIANEDDLSAVPNSINITAKVYTFVTTTGFSGAMCYFYDNSVLLGNSSTNSSGDCKIEWAKSSLSINTRNLTVNYSIPTSDIKYINSSSINVSIIRYVSTLSLNPGHSSKYYDGETATLTISISKINESGTFSYDPQNITANATTSAGIIYSNGVSYYPGNISRVSAGNYTSNVVVNYSFSSLLKWNVWLSDNNFNSYIGSSVHGDVAVCSNTNWSDWATCSGGSQSKTDSSGCIETQTCSVGGGGGGDTGGEEGDGEICTNECTAGETENICVTSGTLRTRTCGGYDSDTCTEWGGESFTQCPKNQMCNNAQCVSCIENWQCSSWNECTTGTQTKTCTDLNNCGTFENKPIETQSCELCQEEWNCQWTECSDKDKSSYPYDCIDNNDCKTSNSKPSNSIPCDQRPKEEDLKCKSQWKCEEWNECDASYDFNDVIKGIESKQGIKKRSCVDILGCKPDKIEKTPCDSSIPVKANKVTWCEKEYVEVKEKESNNLVSRIKKSEIANITNISKIDISFIISEFSGYCDYCYNNIKDYDETGIDCGGENCQKCISKYSFFDWLYWVIITSWIILLITLVYYYKKRKKETISEGKFTLKNKGLSLIKLKFLNLSQGYISPKPNERMLGKSEIYTPRKKNIFIMILFTIITLGIYPSIWYIKEVREFNNLKTEKKINKIESISYLIIIIYLLFLIFATIFKFIITFKFLKGNLPEKIKNVIELTPFVLILFLLFAVSFIALIILFMHLSFRARAIINEALMNKGSNVSISWFFTLIFNLFYLQYEINRIIDNKEKDERIAPWISLAIIIFIITGMIIMW